MHKPRDQMNHAENAALALLHGITDYVDSHFMRTRDVFVAVDTELKGKITPQLMEKAMEMLKIDVLPEDDAIVQVSYEEIMEVLAQGGDKPFDEDGNPQLQLGDLDRNMKEFRV